MPESPAKFDRLPVLDELHEDLERAFAEHGRRPEAHAPRSGRWSPRSFPRGPVALAAIGLAIAAPAVMAGVTWVPQLGRSDDNVPSASAAPVSSEVLDEFALLRREQTSRDRAVAEPLLRQLDASVDEVKTTGIRAIDDNHALVPMGRLQGLPAEQLCLVGDGGIGCNPAREAVTRGVGISRVEDGTTRVIGIVPDEVRRVRFVAEDLDPVEAEVVGNAFSLTVQAVEEGRTPPPLPDGTRPQQMPPLPVRGTLVWLDADGKIVGP